MLDKTILKKGLSKQLIVTGCFILILTCFFFFFRNAVYVERFYSGKIFPVFAIIGQTLYKWTPVSIGDLLYVICSLIGLVLFVKAIIYIFRRIYLMALIQVISILNITLFIVMLFYLLWGGNYFRVPLEVRMALDMEVKESCELLETAAFCIDQANKYRKLIREEDFLIDNRAIFKRATQLLQENAKLKPFLFVYLPTVKEPISDLLINYAMVSGYFNPFTQETQVNSSMPVFSKPFTACHELGHQSGIGFEDEANLVGFILCTQSDDALFQYSAYYHAMAMLLRQVYLEDKHSYLNLIQLIDKEVLLDVEDEQNYWEKFSGLVNDAGSVFYNQYLLLNNQPEGLRRYDRMTKLLIAWRKKY
ncbi:DUF3810 domain-containing protein [Olivibacter sp. SDN3]|uniref:DUF3810 domain-containing protein n=1 Tax=Olivibacter sp. SDN3 TaxID=2764720 RepID=UPI0016519520|nr:DUF3810 domain-containing protein [Olivibacter sp. SDN3]QNL49003.1 DUF3810 domain-containing protein [Olivibacter sp. SDN3]